MRGMRERINCCLDCSWASFNGHDRSNPWNSGRVETKKQEVRQPGRERLADYKSGKGANEKRFGVKKAKKRTGG